MPTQVSGQSPNLSLRGLLAFALLLLAGGSFSLSAQSATSPTVIQISDTAKLTSAKRLGINIGNQDFYDSGMFMRNLAFRNPGFEGETWQSILHCKYVTATSCTDDNNYAVWPANFFAGATAEFIEGSITGTQAKVASSTVANVGAGRGVTVQFSSIAKAPSVGDYVVVRETVPGNAQSGWWTQSSNPSAFSTEFNDLAPNTVGKQALRITTGSGQYATLSNYDDSTVGRSFLQMHGTYTISFRAKGTGGSNQVAISLGRAVDAPPAVTFFQQTVNLSNTWQNYSYTFQVTDVNRVGSIALTFDLYQSSMLIDDVALTAAAGQDNPTVYRDEVVSTLQKLHPGVLRLMDSGTNWGSSIDNMLAPDFARVRAGYNNFATEASDIPLSLPDFLVLCKTIGAEPWYTMQTGMSTQEMSNLMDYLGGSASTEYGAKRAATGQVEPWTTVFPTIHLEFGNEVWNTANPGASMTDPTAYGKRAAAIFTTAKSSPSYNAKSFDLILDGWEALPTYWTGAALKAAANYDTVDVAAYIFSNLYDTSSNETIYGSMFAEPEMINDTPGGLMAQQAVVAAASPHPVKLAIYEENMGTISGSASQSQVNTIVASLGSGLANADNMLLLMRDLGINNQNMFALPGLDAPFYGQDGSKATSSPIWGMVIDMGGPTNLVRPTFLAEQLANSAILPTMLATAQAGANPTWNQKFTPNDNFSLAGAHYVQSFAFTDGKQLNVILLNLSRTTALPVTFSGLNAPSGDVTISTLTASDINATNETRENVAITTRSETLAAGATLSLPPFSMTVVSTGAPAIPTQVTGLTVSCAKTALSPGNTDACSANVSGTGAYSQSVNWTASAGSISTSGVYTAGATAPANGKAVITATSASDSTKSASFTITIAPDAITGITVACDDTSLAQGGSTACSAKVTGTGDFNNGVTWSTTGGSIDGSGNLTAPASGSAITVKAASTQDPTKFATTTISLFSSLVIGTPSISVTANSATVNWSTNTPSYNGVSFGTNLTYNLGTTPFVATQTKTPSLTLSGLKPSTVYYVLLFSINGSQTVFKAASFTTTGSQTTNTVSGVSVSCPGSGDDGQLLTCTAKVSGTGSISQNVVWTTSAGSITADGALTLPANGTSVTVQATSTQDLTKHGSATITLNTPQPTELTIASVATSTTANTATIKWMTGQASHSGISYGTSQHYGSTTPYAQQATASPSLSLTGLKPGTTYYLYLFSGNGKQTATKAITVKTEAE